MMNDDCGGVKDCTCTRSILISAFVVLRIGCAAVLSPEQVKQLWDSVGGHDLLQKRRYNIRVIFSINFGATSVH